MNSNRVTLVLHFQRLFIKQAAYQPNRILKKGIWSSLKSLMIASPELILSGCFICIGFQKLRKKQLTSSKVNYSNNSDSKVNNT